MVTEWLRPRASLCSSERLFSSWTLEGPLISCKCLLENALTFPVNGETLFSWRSFIALQASGHYTHHRVPLNLVWYYLRKKPYPFPLRSQIWFGSEGYKPWTWSGRECGCEAQGRQKMNEWLCVLFGFQIGASANFFCKNVLHCS